MTASRELAESLQRAVWKGAIPLEIRLASADCRSFNNSDPYLIQFPRLSYLGLLLPRLHRFFSNFLIDPTVGANQAWFSYEDVPLKWHYPLGLLYDLYSGIEPAYPMGGGAKKAPTDDDGPSSLPWKLTVHFSDYPAQLAKPDAEGKVLYDAFINSVKEAGFLRTGSGKTVMSLGKEDSTQLWEAVKQQSPSLYRPINQKLLNPQGLTLRHLPIKLYLPHAPDASQDETHPTAGLLRVVQAPVTPMLSSRQPQTVGTALNQILPSLFPSRRSPLLAQPVLHGAVLPLSTTLEDLTRTSSYLDGWLHVVVVMMG